MRALRPVKPIDQIAQADLKLEAAVLACMAMDAGALREVVAAKVCDSHFSLYEHRVMFRAIKRMHDDELAVDVLSLESAMRARGELAEAGGNDAVQKLFDTLPTSSNVVTYVEMLEKLYRTRSKQDQLEKATRALAAGDVEEAQRLAKQVAKPMEQPEPKARAERPTVSHVAARAPVGSMEPLNESEYNLLVRSIAALRRLNEQPEAAGVDEWQAAVVYLMPFDDGRARAEALLARAAGAITNEQFEYAWTEAERAYSRPERAGNASVSQKIVEHMQSDGRPDILPISHGYGILDGAFVKRKLEYRDGRWMESPPVVLTNFTAWVVSQEFQDDGTGIAQRRIRMGGAMAWGMPLPEFDIPAEEWTNMSTWLHKHWGHTTVIFNRREASSATLEAIALFSMDAPIRHVYTHTGWVQRDGATMFITPTGAIGGTDDDRAAFARDCSVSMPENFARYKIPAAVTREEALEGYHWLEKFMRVADLSITAPMVSTLFLAPLSSLVRINFIVAFTGPSDSRKTSLVAAAMTAWGREIDSDNIPLSFQQTKNYIEDKAFHGKDLPVIVDNYVPSISQEQSRTLQNLAHSIGDAQGRGRMLDGHRSLQSKPCRGMMVITGEENCEQYSGAARMYTVAMNRGSVRLDALTHVQVAGAQGKLEPVMTHYLTWLAQKMADGGFAQKMKARWFELARAEQEGSSNHGRLVAQRKWIDIGLELARESHPNGRWHDQSINIECTAQLNRAASARGYDLKESSITSKFFRCIKTLIDSGIIRGVSHENVHYPPLYHADVFGWNTNGAGEGTTPMSDESTPMMWTKFKPDAKFTDPWFVFLNTESILKLIRRELPNAMNDSAKAITAALDGEQMLWVSPKERESGNRTDSCTMPGAGRQRFLRINGDMMLKSLGLSEKEQE